VRRVVLDAGALLDWFGPPGRRSTLRDEYERGVLVVVAPPTIVADAVALIARRTGWAADRLARIAAELGRLRFELRDPEPTEQARFIAAGLAADRAAYPALAAQLDLRLVTPDEALRATAGPLVTAS
jgi:predicted nucleic acid-binding protein